MAERRLSKRQRQEAKDLARFIDAHGGRLGAFRGYGVSRLIPAKAGALAVEAASTRDGADRVQLDGGPLGARGIDQETKA
jgi:hypothetical protein